MWVNVFVRLHMGVGLSVLSVLTVLTVLSALPVLTVLTVLSLHKYVRTYVRTVQAAFILS